MSEPHEIVASFGVPVIEVNGEDVFNPALVVQHHCEWRTTQWTAENSQVWIVIECKHGALRFPLHSEGATIETR